MTMRFTLRFCACLMRESGTIYEPVGTGMKGTFDTRRNRTSETKIVFKSTELTLATIVFGP